MLDREQRRMAHGRVRNAEAVEGGKQLVGRHGHAGSGLKIEAGRGISHEMATVYRRRGRGCKVLRLFAIGTGSGGSAALPNGCGCSSGVEHDLAKVGVEGSNPFARSNT